MLTAIWVAFGGALGALMRYGALLIVAPPYGTFLVNLIGSVAIGICYVLLSQFERGIGYSAFMITGVLGGFTTFSAFSLDTLKLLETGQFAQAFIYALGTMCLCLIACYLAVFFMRQGLG